MPIANDLPEVLETTEPERLATGFIFTEGPLWHPDDYWYFVDLRRNQLLRLTRQGAGGRQDHHRR
jgi:sugar lactone lactonase YvrE